LKEIVNVTVHIIAAKWKKSVVPLTFNYDYKDPFDAPWKIGEFKILSGGAKVVLTDGCTAQLQMPSTMPKEKAVTVQVTLNPVVKKYQQVILLTTIYLEDNDNIFFFKLSLSWVSTMKNMLLQITAAFLVKQMLLQTKLPAITKILRRKKGQKSML